MSTREKILAIKREEAETYGQKYSDFNNSSHEIKAFVADAYRSQCHEVARNLHKHGNDNVKHNP